MSMGGERDAVLSARLRGARRLAADVVIGEGRDAKDLRQQPLEYTYRNNNYNNIDNDETRRKNVAVRREVTSFL